jgi:hypothetical protein
MARANRVTAITIVAAAGRCLVVILVVGSTVVKVVWATSLLPFLQGLFCQAAIPWPNAKNKGIPHFGRREWEVTASNPTSKQWDKNIDLL